jgi:signal transduction histidine kinase
MVTSAVTASPSRAALRDPVLLLPLAVAAGLAVGGLGVHERVAGSRITADLALAWALMTASTLLVERQRRRTTRWLLAATAFALLAADLEWASARPIHQAGRVFAALWPALLAQLTLTFPEGRAWSPTARLTIVGTYAVTISGELFGRPAAAAGVAVALLLLALIGQRARGLRAATRWTQVPLLLGAALTSVAVLAWLGWVIDGAGATTLETVARAVAVTIPLGIVAGIGWSRLQRPQASQLVVELRKEAPTTLSERLGRVLGDPTLEVAYRLDDGRYVDAAGMPIELPSHGERAITPVIAGGDEIAALVHDAALLDEPAFLESVRATTALVLENERLAAEVRSQLAEVRASRSRIVAAADTERRRIERNLHDGAQQRLVTLSVALGLAASRADPATADVLSRAQDDVEQAITELRELARGIHPTLLRDEGLQAAVEALARRAPVPVTVEGTVSGRLPEAVELAAYFLISEALTNVVKHASATGASVALAQQPGRLSVAVTDNGVGGAHVEAGSGLAGLRDRLEALEASLSVTSVDGRGTTIRADFPCAS